MTPAGQRVRMNRDGLRRAIGAALLVSAPGLALGYTVTLNPAAPLTVYLQVGVGSFTAIYNDGGKPGNNTTVNTVSVTVPAGVVGNGTAQAMTTNSTATVSFVDGFTFCTVPGQLYIGGFYRTTGGKSTTAQVVATVPGGIDRQRGRHDSFLENQLDVERHRR